MKLNKLIEELEIKRNDLKLIESKLIQINKEDDLEEIKSKIREVIEEIRKNFLGESCSWCTCEEATRECSSCGAKLCDDCESPKNLCDSCEFINEEEF